MRRMTTLAAVAVVALGSGIVGTGAPGMGSVAQAEPGGCLKYGAAGAVGGHVVHHGVIGALGGCVTGMYRRHVYRKEAKQKAALYDKEHPGAKGTYEEKATAYDVEHSTEPGKMNAGAPLGNTSGQPNTPAQGQSPSAGQDETHF
ncbi:hypothetical protein ACLEIY_15590 [Acetobacter tropicalis]|uniref:hypothetical protein n=1 Tax=Acetobacter tropicalis TaxID=104102 RepID=UPI0039761F3E